MRAYNGCDMDTPCDDNDGGVCGQTWCTIANVGDIDCNPVRYIFLFFSLVLCCDTIRCLGAVAGADMALSKGGMHH